MPLSRRASQRSAPAAVYVYGEALANEVLVLRWLYW